MSSEPITNEELDRLESLHNDAPEQMTDEVLDMEIREWRVFPVEGAQSFYDAAHAALPTLIAAYRQLTIVAARAAELVQADAALIRALEDRLATESTRNERLRTELSQAQSIIARATDHAAKQLQYYRNDAAADGEGHAVYHAALCHHYTLMLDSLTEQEPPHEQ